MRFPPDCSRFFLCRQKTPLSERSVVGTLGKVDMASSIILKSIGTSSLLCAAELYTVKTMMPQLYEPASSDLPFPRLYCLVVFFNMVFSTGVLLTLSMKVGAARSKYKVDYPAMYASGKAPFCRVQLGGDRPR